jgi:hypothetical protein
MSKTSKFAGILGVHPRERVTIKWFWFHVLLGLALYGTVLGSCYYCCKAVLNKTPHESSTGR